MTSALLSFAVVAGLVTIVPGLDTALVLRAALTRGRRVAFATALGVNTGVLVWGVAAAAGLSALLTASQLAFTVLRYAGAAYLVWFGVSMIRKARRPAEGVVEPPVREGGGLAGAWARGALTNLLNPKIGVFYVALLPQFLPQEAPPLLGGLLLAMVHNAEGMLWFTVLIFGAGAARSWLERPPARRVIDRVTGTVLVGFGLRLALSPQ
ncbi:LysE family translocator [Nonomuraea africana]|uniref:Threonine/homoserine/homoserine lactone efflux protein n=1 Tax=Nonomuraea africana TaxID=46171 RepID=A0ABR9KCI2_9ACTN|nr:LysE family translocator [Nonomuraea africana]MBE1559715.1 threonine/homoserine/homoserine lactone efflux protein [Nonomuraea africana]